MIDKRWTKMAIFLLPGLMFLMVEALIAAEKPAKEPTEAPEKVTIDSRGYKKDKKKPVIFDHKKHQEEHLNEKGEKILCTECHHVYKDEKNTWKEGDPVKKCGTKDCHDPRKKKGKKQHKLQLAFHQNCKDCHKAVVKAKKKTEKEAPYKKCIKCMKTE